MSDRRHDDTPALEWRAIGATATGSSHTAAGTPNEDAWAASPPGPVVAVAVADGHGSSRCPRAAAGARLAADIATELLLEVGAADLQGASAVAEHLRVRTGPALVTRWRAQVIEDVEHNPFTSDECQAMALDAGAGAGVGALQPQQVWIAYGCTIVAMVGTRDVIGVLQIGDGDAIIAGLPGSGVIRAVADDPDNIGNVTSSLAQQSPLASLRVASYDTTAAAEPVLGFVASDGFGGAYEEGDWWQQVAADLMERTARLSPQELVERLPAWLTEPAEVAGDDATMVLLYAHGPVDPSAPCEAPPATRSLGADTGTRPADEVSDAAESSPGRRRGRAPWLALGLGTVLVIVVSLAALVARTRGSETFVLSSPEHAVAIDPTGPSLVAHEPQEPYASDSIDDGDTRWHLEGGYLIRTVDGEAHQIAALPAGSVLTIHDNSLWVLSDDGSRVFTLPLEKCLHDNGCLPKCVPVGSGACPDDDDLEVRRRPIRVPG